jgi:hypothetical protein
VFHGYQSEVYVAVDQPLGWLALTKGRHILSFVCVGRDSRSSGYNFGINDVVLERVPEGAEPATEIPPIQWDGSRSSTWPMYRGVYLAGYLGELRRASETVRPAILRAIGAFGVDAASAVTDVVKALGDPVVEVRVAAAWALSQMGTAGAAAVPALEKSVADSELRVRSLSAIALGSMGPAAAKAIPGLAKALDDPSPSVRAAAADAIGNLGAAGKPAVETLSRRLIDGKEPVVFVLRSLASALGNIGAPAASALPALEQVLKVNRVRWAAQEAILKIKGEPVPLWY